MNRPDDFIPMLDLTNEIDELWEEINSSVRAVFKSGRFVLGQEVGAFEEEVARFLGVRHAIALNSGTDALVIGLRALGIGPGDEVITTSFSFFATAEAIINVGATPVFVDVDEDTFNIDPLRVEAVVSDRTKAIIPVHLFGLPAAMGEIKAIAQRHNIKVLEDCAQSFGAIHKGVKTGAIGHAAAFSFYPTKNLGACGDGGMLVTSDDEVAHLARMLRNHGASAERRYENRMTGYNSRLDEIQAAVLRVKLPHVQRWNEQRRYVADRYLQRLAALPSTRLPADDPEHVYHQFTIRVPAEVRDELANRLKVAGVATSVFYPVPLHRLAGVDESLPVSDKLAGEVLSLPMGPFLEPEVQEVIAHKLADQLNQLSYQR